MMLGLARGEGAISPARLAPDAVPTARLKPGRSGQLLHFAGVGAISTVTFAVLFALLYGPFGAVGADVLALALCALGNLAANRRFTFTDRGPAGRRDYYAKGLTLSLLPLATTLVALAATSAAGVVGPGGGPRRHYRRQPECQRRALPFSRPVLGHRQGGARMDDARPAFAPPRHR